MNEDRQPQEPIQEPNKLSSTPAQKIWLLIASTAVVHLSIKLLANSYFEVFIAKSHPEDVWYITEIVEEE